MTTPPMLRLINGPRVGPWPGGGYLIAFNNPDQSNWAKPNFNVFTIDLHGLGLGDDQVHTINGYITELQSADYPYPHMGDAIFYTVGVTLDFATQVATVTFFMFWGSPLPVGLMANVGFDVQRG